MPDTEEMPFGPDLILSEMNHRWCNGLQVISAALCLYGRHRTADAVMEEQLLGLGDQVQAMAALHRRLSGPPLIEESFETHCRSLCLDVTQSFGRPEVTPRLEMDDPGLSLRGEHRLALLVVELMTNALKHGRPPNHGAMVWLTLKRSGLSHIDLTVWDNFGPPDPNVTPPKLVRALVADLRGTLTVDVAPAYRSWIRIPIL
jgi:two-component sensor histidine kinase